MTGTGNYGAPLAPLAWRKGWGALDASTFASLLALDVEALRACWDATPRITRTAPLRRDGSADVYIGTTQDSIAAQDDEWDALTRTDDGAALSDEWDALTWDEWSSDDAVTCWASVALTMGESVALSDGRTSARTGYIGPRYVGMATGKPGDVRTLRRIARESAQRQALAARTAARASLTVLGRADDARGAGWISTREEYAQIRSAVMRHVFGNAGRFDRATGARGAAHVRAGITASGMPLDVHQIDDATQNACLILQRWASRDAFPATLAEILSDADTDSATRAVIGAAARDGVRRTTAHKRATVLAAAHASYRAARESEPMTRADAVGADRSRWDARRAAMAQERAARAAGKHGGMSVELDARSGGYVGSADSADTDLLDRILSRGMRTLAALVIADGNLDSAARMLGRATGRASGAARRAILAAARAEWDALETDSATPRMLAEVPC